MSWRLAAPCQRRRTCTPGCSLSHSFRRQKRSYCCDCLRLAVQVAWQVRHIPSTRVLAVLTWPDSMWPGSPKEMYLCSGVPSGLHGTV